MLDTTVSRRYIERSQGQYFLYKIGTRILLRYLGFISISNQLVSYLSSPTNNFLYFYHFVLFLLNEEETKREETKLRLCKLPTWQPAWK